MGEYKYDEESVKSLIEWAETTSFPKELRLNDAENIIDLKRYVLSNLSDINGHYPDDFYNPAIIRLYQLKEKLEEA